MSDAVAAAALSLAVDARSAGLVDTLDREGIPSVLLKGPTLRRWLYPDEVRTYSDIDILVPPGEMGRVRELLGGLGYAPSPDRRRQTHAEPLFRYGDAVEKIDVHRSFHYIGADADAFWTIVDRDAIPFPLAGGEVRAASLPARALLVALHAAVHGPAPQWREDLRRAVGVPEVWPRAVDLARELDAVTGLTAGLRSIPEGARLADAYGLHAVDPAAMRLATHGAPTTAGGLLALMDEPTMRARAKLLVRELVPSRRQMRENVPLARRGQLGMIAAYALRPVSLARALPRGWRGVRALRGAAARRRD